MPPTAAELELAQKDQVFANRVVVPFEIKQDSVDEEARTFSGLAAVFNDLDLGDDIIHPGSFTKTLREFRRSPTAMPLLNSHDHFNIFSALGQMLDAKETRDGLLSSWEIIDGPDGDATLTRLRPSKRTGKAVVGSMSIGYEPMKFDFEQSDEARFGRIRNLREVKLLEVSLVLFPMAPGALIDLQSVKTLIAKKQATPEQLEALLQFTQDLAALLKTAVPESSAAEAHQSSSTEPTEVDAPDLNLLDTIRVQRLRLSA